MRTRNVFHTITFSGTDNGESNKTIRVGFKPDFVKVHYKMTLSTASSTIYLLRCRQISADDYLCILGHGTQINTYIDATHECGHFVDNSSVMFEVLDSSGAKIAVPAGTLTIHLEFVKLSDDIPLK